jgi:hypothetical protein
VIEEVVKKQLQEREKVSGLQKVMGEVQHQISQINKAVERQIGADHVRTGGDE